MLLTSLLNYINELVQIEIILLSAGSPLFDFRGLLLAVGARLGR